ncbi:MAG: phage tail protein [Casimicrobium sp.]
MSEPFIGEVRIFGFDFAPRNWAQCNGQLLSIAQNQALFSLLGVTYGGNGTTNFALPNLQGRAAMGIGDRQQGLTVGTEAETLTLAHLPSHTHEPAATTSTANAAAPSGAVFASSATAPYRTGGVTAVALDANTVSIAGGSQPHSNMQPYTVLNCCIALSGIFPSRP